MCNPTLLLAFTFIASFALCDAGDVSISLIEWVSVNKSELVLMRMEPAGIEQGTNHFYVCRVNFQGQLLSGKVRVNEDNHCYFPSNGTCHRMAEFEVLRSSPSTTSWVPYSNLTVNASAIVTSNRYWDWEKRYVCRAIYEDHVIPGTLFPDGVCFIDLNETEIRVDNQEDIEILVINNYGIRLGVTQAWENPLGATVDTEIRIRPEK